MCGSLRGGGKFESGRGSLGGGKFESGREVWGESEGSESGRREDLRVCGKFESGREIESGREGV